jgi:hypothetical protein
MRAVACALSSGPSPGSVLRRIQRAPAIAADRGARSQRYGRSLVVHPLRCGPIEAKRSSVSTLTSQGLHPPVRHDK